jgi:hypothetical protein
MNNKTKMGMNKTGIATSPLMGPQMIKGAELFAPEPGDGKTLAGTRAEYFSGAPPVGTMPPPASLKEVAANTLEMLKGNKGLVFVDKLGERLAFERTGSRLYETVIAHFDASPTWDGGPSRDELLRILHSERQHFHLLKECIETLGSDPTAITPSAEVSAVASIGLLQVVGDPRMSLRHALHAALVAELVDNEGWATLIDLGTSLGHDAMVERFRAAHLEEVDHLMMVRGWVKSAVIGEANLELNESEEDTGQAPVSH